MIVRVESCQGKVVLEAARQERNVCKAIYILSRRERRANKMNLSEPIQRTHLVRVLSPCEVTGGLCARFALNL